MSDTTQATEDAAELEASLENLFQYLILHEDPWVIQVHRPGSERAPYVQGARNDDGSFVIELSNNDIHEPKLTSLQLGAITAFGWQGPGIDGSPNYLQQYADDTQAADAARLLTRTLLTVFRFDAGDADRAGDTIEIEVFETDLSEIIEENPALPLV